MFGLASWFLCMAIGRRDVYMTYRLPLYAKEKSICSLPDAETERARSVNDF